jgi:hypothetical protein
MSETMEPMQAPPAGPRCAEHPDRVARSTPCERCGNFTCEACFDDPASEVCKSCRERTGLGGGVPWESPSLGFFDRLWGTMQRAITEPRATFRSIGSGPLPPSFTFFLATLALGYAPLLLCLPIAGLGMGIWMESLPNMPSDVPGGSLAAMMCGMIAILPIYMLVVHALVVLYYLVVFHGTAILLGGYGSVSGSLRGILYTGAIMPLTAIGLVFGWIPLVGSLVQLVIMGTKMVWTGFALAGTAESVHGLKDERALLAGHLPGALAIVLFIGLFALAIGMVLMSTRL